MRPLRMAGVAMSTRPWHSRNGVTQCYAAPTVPARCCDSRNHGDRFFRPAGSRSPPDGAADRSVRFVRGGHHRGDLSGGGRRDGVASNQPKSIMRSTARWNAPAVPSHRGLWRPELFLGIAAGTLLVVALGSLYKIAELSAGGESVALMLGGRAVDPQTTDLAERRLLNVVEEMALASGIPVPPVFVLDNEPSINAFAAGHQPGDAVVAVSAGALRYLSREELQGVMGHEFSHILNGDMRLNLRLIGVVNGILVLAILGYYILRFGGLSSRRLRQETAAARPSSCSAWRWSSSATSACSSAI